MPQAGILRSACGYLLLVGGVRDRLVPLPFALPGRLILADDLFHRRQGQLMVHELKIAASAPYQKRTASLQARSADPNSHSSAALPVRNSWLA